MNERDKYLLQAGYEQGFQNANFITDDGAKLTGTITEEAARAPRWLSELMALLYDATTLVKLTRFIFYLPLALLSYMTYTYLKLRHTTTEIKRC